jgi:hypothetical protein
VADSYMLDTSLHMSTTFAAGMDDPDEAVDQERVLIRDEVAERRPASQCLWCDS